MGHENCSPFNLRHWGWNSKATYWCPCSNPGLGYCNSPYEYYCAYWGCETIAMAWVPGRKDKHLNVTWEPHGCGQPGYAQGGNVWKRGNCTSLKVTILQPRDNGWLIGRTWGVRYWQPGTDTGVSILIQKREVTMSQAIGPNRVINRQKKKKKRPRVKNPWASVTPEEYSFPTSESILTSEVEGEPKDDKPL